MQSELVRQSAKSEMSTNEGEREGATEEKRDNSLSGGAGKAFVTNTITRTSVLTSLSVRAPITQRSFTAYLHAPLCVCT